MSCNGYWMWPARPVVPAVVVVAATVSQLPPAIASSHTHVSNHPEIQMWSYPAASANGAGSVRDRATTFAAYSTRDENNQPVFYQGDGYDPARRGSFIAITNTSTNVPIGLDPARYQIDSLRVTTTLLGSLIYEPLGYVLHYDGTLDDSAALTGGVDTDVGRPIEMYGIGWQGDYEAVSFQSGDTDPTHFNLGDVRWKAYQPGDPEYDPEHPNAISPYQFFALDANGDDAENAVFGGYSATAAGNETPQFTSDPFAIGKLYDSAGDEAAAGTLLENGDQFVFEPSLTNSGIIAYLQNSLTQGHLGFSFSSLHEPSGHEGTVPYPDFYLDDLDVGHNPNGAAPKIELSVTILDPFSPGDYDRDRDVNADDLATWRQSLGSVASPNGSGADGNGDGNVDAADFVIWQKLVAAAGQGGTSTLTVSAPEPATAMLFVICAAIALCTRGRHA